ncbi:cysteine hydrolase [Bacillus sp. AGMB 02131]|uniref:Cysteine hydrolase n=1 Tax=Peribacillus faecalis TaxID=2772559 RepID=A0A927D0J9_9BACI|nr:isochorismatase family cysteine hydrolase [Peribacillus faecalis]MBD3110037.1 cysteine hydrolase [Peribacillus faecalis]
MIQKNKKALLIIDIINHFQFEHGTRLLEQSLAFLPALIQLKQRAKIQQIPIIYINDHYNLWQADFKKIISHCTTDETRHFLSQIQPDDDDYFLIKPKHSAFFGTALNTLLYHLNVDQLILTGIAGNICVLFTANDAYMREYTLNCPKDCIASVSKQDNEYALMMMQNVLQADLTESHKLLL